MAQKEYFYTAEFFKSAGLEPFKEHTKQYLDGQRTVPVSKTGSYFSRDIFFTFSNNLLETFLEQPNSIMKPYETALKYGFRGYSIGEKNGIFQLHKSDRGLIRSVDRLIVKHKDTIREDLDLQENDLDALRKIKIVWHKPSGERVVGVYNTNNDRMLFLDFAQY